MPDHETSVTGMLWVVPDVREKWSLLAKISRPFLATNNAKIMPKASFCLLLQKAHRTQIFLGDSKYFCTPPLKGFRSGSLWKYINGSSQNMIDIKRLNDDYASWVYIIWK